MTERVKQTAATLNADLSSVSIAALESLIDGRKNKLSSLYERRDQLRNEVAALDAEIAIIEGKRGTTRGRPASSRRTKVTAKPVSPVQRAGRAKSLKIHVEEALSGNKKGLTLAEIHATVLESGYSTTSENFKNVLYQMLYHDWKTFFHNKQTKRYTLRYKSRVRSQS